MNNMSTDDKMNLLFQMVRELSEDMKDVKQDVAVLKKDVSFLKRDISTLKSLDKRLENANTE